ncbi:phosphate ABC transporter substrate-binding protein [Blastopirellula sp. JC732]|uniref:Phosphate-binding protein n=1 Tax=Blastopirellula sediminis TaxID=2894196 RepID=A0A9X1SGY7_9BACT|nr:phosphate ABC transporter substrate-binding protein [Blastopirellula sediminis]MCC9606061.1 phosphate ABC transporter substrate-binding protein [Blastopirellula sediminis]MCC9630640.1 phosphate ABC transporter substrate-binding protein [Blastopirellula sediminis]
MNRCRNIFMVAALAVAAPLAASAQVQVDSALPSYKPVQGVNGNISSMGSDTMNNLMTLWAEGFQKFYPGVTIEIEGKGSSTAPAALTKGTATFGPMSRPMKESEIDAFEKAYGYKPTQLGTSIDMLAVFVHKDNPVKGLSLEQLDSIFSSTRKGGAKDDVTTWGQLGLEGAWASRAISLYGRNSASGTYGYFKEKALFDGDYKSSVKEQPGSSAVIQGVANDVAAIGYSGIGYKTAAVRVVPLSKTGDKFVEPSLETVSSYPLSRFLYLSVNRKPNEQLDPLRLEFIKYVFSKEGQEAVVKDGYLPLTAKQAQRQLDMILKN